MTSGSGKRETGRVDWVRKATRSVWLLFTDAAASLVQRPGHTLGMVSGIALGVASAVASVVIADTQQAHVDLTFDLQRSSYVVLTADGLPDSGFPEELIGPLTSLDAVTGVGEVSVWSHLTTVRRSMGSPAATGSVVVADPAGLAASGTRIVQGAGSALISETSGQPVAWVGRVLARRLGVGPVDGAAGQDSEIVIDGVAFGIAGVLGNTGSFSYLNNSVVVSRAAAVKHLPLGSDAEFRLLLHVRPGAAAAIAKYVIRAFRLAGSEIDLTNRTPPDSTQIVAAVGGDLRDIGVALALIVGLVGVLSVINTLMLSVHQRMRELGLRSAIGWSGGRIASLVLAESAVAGLAAGAIGSAVGVGVAGLWCWIHGWTLVVAGPLPVLVIACGAVASAIGGVIPAARAASISPLEAMRA